MKRKSFFRLAGLAAVVGVGFIACFLFSSSWRKTGAPSEPATQPQLALTSPAQSTSVNQAATRPETKPSLAEPTAPVRENVVPQSGGPARAVVRVKPDRVLATVNGVSITLKDLVPLPKDKAGTEQMLSAEMYEFLFQRAIDREVTFQAARAQGADLTENQKQRLAAIGGQSERRDPNVFDTLHASPENAEFEQRDLSGLALQSVLAEKAGVPAPYVTSEQVEAYFQEHKSEYPQVSTDPGQRSSESWRAADTDIRSKLTPLLQAEHDRQMAQFMAELKAKAGVVVVAQQQ